MPPLMVTQRWKQNLPTTLLKMRMDIIAWEFPNVNARIMMSLSSATDEDSTMATVAKLAETKGHRKWFGGSDEGDNMKAVHLDEWCDTGEKRNTLHHRRLAVAPTPK